MSDAWIVPIRRLLSVNDPQVGDILYHDHRLMRVTSIGKPKNNATSYKFRVIGTVNLDRRFRQQTGAASPPVAGTSEKED